MTAAAIAIASTSRVCFGRGVVARNTSSIGRKCMAMGKGYSFIAPTE